MDASLKRKRRRRRSCSVVATIAVLAAAPGVNAVAPEAGAVASSPNGSLSSDTTCGTNVAVPGDAEHPQQVWGDVDGDTVPDPVTVYAFGGAWHVNVISSVKNRQSDTTLHLDVQAWVAPSFEDIDHALGADVPPPVAIMATGTGPNTEGVLGNFTFLTMNTDYCVKQWQYQGAPFQWVALQAPGHMTGLRCDGAAGSIAYVLTDSLQNEDGSWKVISERITHNFRTAIITPLETVTVSAAEFTADHYGNIFQCGHASLPLGSDITAPSTPPATSPAPPATGGTAAPTTAPTAVDYGNDAFVAAWSSGDDATLALLGTPDAVSAVHAHDDIRGGPWTLVASEGAMGTGYATYADPNGNELTIGTGNEAAATGQPHAVYTVQFP